jgi:hypothetical protein
MRRHSIIARLGPSDRAHVETEFTNSVTTQIRFIDGERRFGYGIGQAIDRLAERGIVPSEIAVDLMLLAATVTAADTRISRATESQDSWTREINLHIPVQNTALWSGAAPLIVRSCTGAVRQRVPVLRRSRQLHRRNRLVGKRPESRVR